MHQRNTKQRRVILEELKMTNSHPTAQELHEIVKKRLPNISLSTVYRNLEQLFKEKLINKIETSGSENRYDGDISDHLHIRCYSCGDIGDLKVTSDQVITPIKILSDWKVIGSHTEYMGICPKCNKQESTTNFKEGRIYHDDPETAGRI